jgi:hypothetical protein
VDAAAVAAAAAALRFLSYEHAMKRKGETNQKQDSIGAQRKM